MVKTEVVHIKFDIFNLSFENKRLPNIADQTRGGTNLLVTKKSVTKIQGFGREGSVGIFTLSGMSGDGLFKVFLNMQSSINKRNKSRKREHMTS